MEDSKNSSPSLPQYPLSDILEEILPRPPAHHRWMIWGGFLACVLVVGTFWWNTYLLPSPNRTLQVFCEALDRGDSATIVTLLTPSWRSFEEHSKPSGNSIIYCTPRRLDWSGCHLITARLASHKDVVLTVDFKQDANNNWLIDDISSPQPHDSCLQ